MIIVKGYAKAILGGLLAGLITLSAVAVNVKTPADVTFIQWVIVAISFLGTATGVYAIPNRAEVPSLPTVIAIPPVTTIPPVITAPPLQ